jgi:hypothetical protein
MNTFEYLNTWNSNTVSFTDNRPAGVRFKWPFSEDLSFTVETTTFTVQRSNDIVEIIQPATALVEYEIDVSAVSGSSVNWSTIPSGCSISSGSGIYIMRGIDSISDWETVRAPTITIPDTFQGSFFYTATIRYTTSEGVQEESWQVGTYVPVSDMQSTATLSCTGQKIVGTTRTLTAYFDLETDITRAGFSGPDTFDFFISNTDTITGNPTIVYEEGDGTEIWTITITPSTTTIIDTMSTSGSGGTSNFNNTSKVLTLTGTETQVESHLNSISLTTTSTKSDAYLLYEGSQDGDPSTTYSVQQTLNCLNLDYLTDPRGDATYTTGVESNIGLDGPQIYDPDYTGNGLYTLTLTPTIPSQITEITSTGIEGWGVEQEYTYTASSTGTLAEAGYGSSNNVLLIGNILESTNASNGGSLHWFIKTDYEYTLVKSVYGSDLNGYLSSDIKIADDDTVIVSEYGYGTNKGRVFVYERGSGNTWTLAQTLTPPDNQANSYFGKDIAISRDGDTLAISEPTAAVTGDTREGRVHIYTRTGTGNYTRQTTILDPDSEAVNSSFSWSGITMSSDGTRLSVRDGVGDSDSYIFSGSGASWSEDVVYENDSRQMWFTSDGTRYLYEDSTSIYVMTRQGDGSWSQTTSFTPSSTFYAMQLSEDDSTVIIKLVNSQTDYEFMRIDFDESTNSFLEDRTIDLTGYMDTIVDWGVNLDGSELVAVGTLDNGDRGFVTYTDGPKPGTFNPTSKTYTIQGTKAEVNADIDTITLTSNSVSNIQITYDLTTPETNTDDKSVTVTNAG